MNDQSEAFKSSPKNDYREYLRKNCYLPIVEPEQNTEPFGNVLNLSTSGLFMVTKGGKDQAEPLKARFFVPNVSNPISFLGKVVYVKNEGSGQFLGMGVRFLELDGEHKKALRSYILNHGFNETLSGYQKKSDSSAQNLKPFNEVDAIKSIFFAASQQQAPVQIFWCRRYTLVTTHLQDVGQYHLSLKISEPSNPSMINRYDHLYLGMTYRGASYFFEATVKYIGNDSLTITKPEVIYFEERRVETRYAARPIGDVQNATVELRLGEGREQSVQRVVEFTSSGLSFHIPLGDDFYSPGQIIHQINLIKGKEIQKREGAKVVHVTPINERQVKVGLKYHIERQPFEFRQVTIHKDQEKTSYRTILKKSASNSLARAKSFLMGSLKHPPAVHVVKYYNKKGEEIVGILNMTFDPEKARRRISAPVIIIPPAFGRRKETTCLLAYTIVENFKKLGKEILVIRYDGIRSIGESYTDPECQHDGHEMLNFTTSQAIEDLLTTIDYVHNETSPIRPTETIIVSFSNAAVVARKAILKDEKHNITFWISVMGITDPQDLVMNATCGIDYFSNYEKGDKEGSFELLGHRVKKEILGDAIVSRVAYLTDAREDMEQLKVPVTWIYGKYDYWTNQARVKDVMSIKTAATRTVIEVPTGHIVRVGKEAIRVFGLIVESAWKQIHGSSMEADLENYTAAELMNQAEWARVKRHQVDYKAYWKEYLLGKQVNGLGFDVLSLTGEYQEMMGLQVDLLNLQEGDLIGDMGGGTGNLTQNIVRRNGLGAGSFPSLSIVQVDFVSEILQKSKTKHNKIIGQSSFPLQLQYVSADLNVKRNNGSIPFPENCFSKVISSLVISYLEDPAGVVQEFYRVIRPGGTVIISSLKRDTDMSKAFHDLIGNIKNGEVVVNGFTQDEILSSLKEYINATAHLSDLEEEGLFRFYTEQELIKLLVEANFVDVKAFETGGAPPQILVAIGRKN